MTRAEDRPEYAHLREFKKTHQWDLIRRYGAHSIGIGWKRSGGESTGELALVFYVARKGDDVAAPIPLTFSYTPEGGVKAVELVTDVVESPMAQFESSEEE